MSRYKRYPKYRDSGVEWIGEVPEGWEVYRFKWAIAESKNGIWGNEPNGEEDIACVRVADFDRNALKVSDIIPTVRAVSVSERSGRILHAGDLLLEKSGGGEKQPVGQMVLYASEEPAVCSNFVARLAVKQTFSAAFWNYQFAAAYFNAVNVRSIKQTSGIQNLDQEQYLSEEAAVPRPAEQTAIASYLDRATARIDALVAKKTRFITLLKEKRQALITHAVTKGLNLNAKMKDSGVEWIGEVPEGWDVVELKRAVVFQRGHDLPEQERNIGTVPVISSAGAVGVHDTAVAHAPGIVTGRYGSIGSFTYVTEDYWPLNTALYSIEFYENQPRYVWYLLQSVSDLFILNSAKSAVPGVDRNDIHKIAIVLPPPANQRVISSYLDRVTASIDSLTARVARSITLLQEKRATLITAAVTGKILVGDGA